MQNHFDAVIVKRRYFFVLSGSHRQCFGVGVSVFVYSHQGKGQDTTLLSFVSQYLLSFLRGLALKVVPSSQLLLDTRQRQNKQT